MIIEQLDLVRKNEGLNTFEAVKGLTIELRPFMDLGIYTPTMKLKREAARQVFKEKLNLMYTVPTPNPSPTFVTG